MPSAFLAGAIRVISSPTPVPIRVANPTPIIAEDWFSPRLSEPYLISSKRTEVKDSWSIMIPRTLTP